MSMRYSTVPPDDEKEEFTKAREGKQDLVIHPVYEDCKFLKFQPPLLSGISLPKPQLTQFQRARDHIQSNLPKTPLLQYVLCR